MSKSPQEWLKQADYDMETAEIMFDNKRHIYKDYNTVKTKVLLEKSKVVKVIKFLEESLREKNLNISKIILFGSYAKGKPTGESDIDILIVSNDFQNKDILERATLTKDAEIMTIKKFMIPLDIITMTHEELESETSLIAEYVKDGEVIYG